MSMSVGKTMNNDVEAPTPTTTFAVVREAEAVAEGNVEHPHEDHPKVKAPPALAADWIGSTMSLRRSMARRWLPWLMVAVVTIAGTGIITKVLVLEKKCNHGNNNRDSSSLAGDDDDDRDAGNKSWLDIPDSHFANPAAVTWAVLPSSTGAPAVVAQQQQNDYVMIPLRMDMSADGRRLVVSSPILTSQSSSPSSSSEKGSISIITTPSTTTIRRHVQIFQYHNMTNNKGNGAWMEMARLERNDSTGFGRSVAMSGNGRVVAIGASDKVWTYHYHDVDNDDDSEAKISSSWHAHSQPILGLQDGDGTGDSVALNHDATLLAVGAPGTNIPNPRAGQVRFYYRPANHSATSWWQFVHDLRGSHLGDGVGGRHFLLSADGRTAVDGSPMASSLQGGFGSGQVWAWRRRPWDVEGNGDAVVSPSQYYWGRLGNTLVGPTGNARDTFTLLATSATGNVLATRIKTFQVTESGVSNSQTAILVYAWTTTTTSTKIAGWQLRGQALQDDWYDACLSADGKVLVVIKQDAAAVYQYEDNDNDNYNGTWIQVGNTMTNPNTAITSGQHTNANKGEWVRVSCSADARVVAMSSNNHYSDKNNKALPGSIQVWQAGVV